MLEHNPSRLYRGPVGVILEPLVRRARGHGLARRHRWIWKAHKIVWRLTRSNRILIQGHDLLLDPGDSLGLSSGDYEPEERRWYESVLKSGDFVVEVGANIGYFTTILARAVGPNGRVIAYEPDPQVARILQRNVTHNGYQNVTVRTVAVADRSGSMTFYRSTRNRGDNRLFSHGRDAGSFQVPTVTLDQDLTAQFGLRRRVDLLKMDIQGAEPLAVDGLRQGLTTAPPKRILMEFWPHGIAGMGRDPRVLVQTLRQNGYSITTLDGCDFDLDKALRELTIENMRWVNLVCTHWEADEE